MHLCFLNQKLLLTLFTCLCLAAKTEAKDNHNATVLNAKNINQGPLVWDQKPNAPAKNMRFVNIGHGEQYLISGSGAMSAKNIQELKVKTKGKSLTIIDLRHEPHAHFYGTPISWYGPRNSIVDTETQKTLIEKANNHRRISIATIHQKKNSKITRATATHFLRSGPLFSSAQLAESLAVNYKHLPNTDHIAPDTQQIDNLVQIHRSKSINDHFHFHCRAGRGRTTTYMVLFDIIKNAHHDNLDTILDRHIKAGGKDLQELPAPSSWKYQAHVNRLDTVKAFYKYRLDQKAFGKISFTNWVKKH